MKLGTDIHAVLADQKPFEELTPEGQDIATQCLNDFSDMIGQLDLGERTKEIVEERYWYDDLFSGQIDRIDFFGDTAVITDYKTGRTPQSNAAENFQLRAYAVLVKRAFPELKTILAAIIQPLAKQRVIVEYSEADLAAAELEIVGIVSASLRHDAPRNPSPDACKWCNAKNICPERLNAGKTATNQIQVVSSSVVATLSNDELADLDDKASIVEDFIESVRKEIKARLASGQVIAGRRLGKGRTTRNVTDTAAALSALADVLPHDVLLDCAKLSVTSLEKALAKARGIKPTDAKPALEEALGWLIETTEGSPSIIRDNN
jgi:CRISPR/Cas system-associated exonuclease Cas4 (RecB family)